MKTIFLVMLIAFVFDEESYKVDFTPTGEETSYNIWTDIRGYYYLF